MTIVTKSEALGETAQITDYSLFHFTREFPVSTGYTPHAYLAERWLDAAKRLLAFCDLPLVEMAHINGFSDQANFNKAFHKSVGISPGWNGLRPKRLEGEHSSTRMIDREPRL